jgi:hypothetical protein
MREIKVLSAHALGSKFIPEEFLPEGQDENYLRDLQVGKPADSWRQLRSHEIAELVKNGVSCDDWDSLYVSDPFTPHLIKNCEFSGLVRIGRLEEAVLEHHELKTPAGITNSRIIACDIGDNAAIHNVRYLSRYIVGNHVILLNIDEMHTTNHAKFGNGIVKEGESESVRVWMELMNEAGGRAVLPFDGMIAADAYLWAKYRDDTALLERLQQITDAQFDSRRGFFGIVGDAAVVKNSQILKDVKIGPGCYIKGANKLKNLTINSREDDPSQIGEGVELVNGIVGYGCYIFYGCKAVRFVLGDHAKLKYGARLIHSFLGDNSTVSCCEILNNLVFPGHEQHHNNSFLVAALVMGQSNIAAGATIGSNHNSRANDGEIQAGRGFWPGLCTTLKHSCRFASFVLLAKGDYPAELNIPLPFALIHDDVPHHRLLVTPAYWWNSNLYALTRNAWKYAARDRRKHKTQHIEFDALAPDTVEEILHALTLLEIWTGRAALRQQDRAGEDPDAETLAGIGRQLLRGPGSGLTHLEVLGEGLENSRRKTVISKPWRGYRAYREMLHYYAVRNLLDYLRDHPQATVAEMNEALCGARQRDWISLGGQLVPAPDVHALREDIKAGTLPGWQEIHTVYDRLWKVYPRARQRHAFATLLVLLETDRLTPALWNVALDEWLRIQEHICDQVYRTRKKDYENPFRQATFRNAAEMAAVVGTAEDDRFVKQVSEETQAFRELVASVRSAG